jgi:hypothetical protein
VRAFWRNAPGVRFIALAIVPIGVLAFECFRRSAKSAFVHATIFLRFTFFEAVAPVAAGVLPRFATFDTAAFSLDLAFDFFAITDLHYKELRYCVRDTKKLTFCARLRWRNRRAGP